MRASEIVGYIASGLVLLTFTTTEMRLKANPVAGAPIPLQSSS